MSFKSWVCRSKQREIDRLEDSNVALYTKIEGLQILLKAAESESNTYTFKEAPLNYDEPEKIYYKDIYNLFGDAEMMFNADYYAYGIDKEDVQRILDRNSQISDANYLAELNDCEDFASATLGLFNQPTLARFAFGYAVSKSHAYNFFVDRNKELWIVEPQNRRIVSQSRAVNQGNDMYKTIKYFV